MKLSHVSVLSLPLLLFAGCSEASEEFVTDAARMDVIDLAKEPDSKESVLWTGRRVKDVVDISQVAHFILVDSCSSAPPQVLFVGMIDLLSAENAVFEAEPPDWDPQALPAMDVLLVAQNGDVYRITKRGPWFRITSAQGHGSFRQSDRDGTAEDGSRSMDGMSIKAMNDLASRMGVDLTYKPNLKKNRLWRKGAVSDAFELGDIVEIVIYQSTTGEPFESDEKKLRTLIEHGRAIALEQHGIKPEQLREHVPVISALIVTRSKAYYRIVVREDVAQITSVAGHGYYAIAADTD